MDKREDKMMINLLTVVSGYSRKREHWEFVEHMRNCIIKAKSMITYEKMQQFINVYIKSQESHFANPINLNISFRN